MKQFLFLTSAVIAAIFNQGEEAMKLVNTQTGYVVVEFQKGKAQFNDRFLEAEMKESGILIPPALSDQFDGKEVIFPDDPLFEKAFVQVYYPLCISNQTYEWQK